MSNLKPIRVRIQNFQSIEDISLDIKGLTVITGKTNIGKSAIVRAISSAILNNSVIGMVRKGSNFATVEISSDNYAFKWEKGEKGVNRYSIGDRLLDKVGGKQIEDVSQMGFQSVKVGSEDVYPWLASQFFPIFLLDKPGSQVTEFISEVSRLNVIQDAINLSYKKKKRLNDQLAGKESELKRIQIKKEAFVSLPDVLALKKDIEEQLKSIEEYETRIEGLNALSARLKTFADKIIKIQKVSSVRTPQEVERSEFDVLRTLASLDTKTRVLSKSVESLIKIETVDTPGKLDEYESYSNMKKYAWIQGEIETVRELDHISGMQIPDNLKDTINDYERKLMQHVKIQKLTSHVNNLTEINVPEELTELSKYQEAKVLQDRLQKEYSEGRKLKIEWDILTDEYKKVEEAISEIPLCPTCTRPHAAHP